MNRSNRRRLWLYGDSAYSCSNGVIAPYKHPLGHRYLTSDKRQFNKNLSSIRISVEYGFGEVARKWTYNSFGMQLYSGKQAVAAFFKAAVLLTNCYVCMNGYNQTSGRYSVRPPSLEEYLDLDEDELMGSTSM